MATSKSTLVDLLREFIRMPDDELGLHSGATAPSSSANGWGCGYRELLVNLEAMFLTKRKMREFQRSLNELELSEERSSTVRDFRSLRKSKKFVEELCNYVAGEDGGRPWWRCVAHKIHYTHDPTTYYIRFFIVTHTRGEQRADSPFRFIRPINLWVNPQFTTLSEVCACNPVTLALVRGVQEGGELATMCALGLYLMWD